MGPETCAKKGHDTTLNSCSVSLCNAKSAKTTCEKGANHPYIQVQTSKQPKQYLKQYKTHNKTNNHTQHNNYEHTTESYQSQTTQQLWNLAKLYMKLSKTKANIKAMKPNKVMKPKQSSKHLFENKQSWWPRTPKKPYKRTPTKARKLWVMGFLGRRFLETIWKLYASIGIFGRILYIGGCWFIAAMGGAREHPPPSWIRFSDSMHFLCFLSFL